MVNNIRSRIFLPILIILVVLISPLLGAEDKSEKAEPDDFGALMKEAETTEESKKVMDQLISLDLRGMTVDDAFKYLALRGGMNIVVSKNVSGRITFMVKNVPIKDVFNIILRSNNLAYEKIGDVYMIMTEKEYVQRYGEQFSDTRKVKIFRLQYAIPENVFNLIDALKSEIGRIIVDQESGTVLAMDTPEKLAEIEKSIQVLETKGSIKVFDLQYAKAEDVEKQLKGRLDAKKAGTIKSDVRTNQLIVQTLPERMETIAKLIKSLDQKTKQVLIDAQIVKVTLSDDFAVGVEWEGLFSQLADYGVDFIGSHPFSPLDRVATSFIDDFATRVAKTSDLDDDARVHTSTDLPTPGQKTTATEKIYFGKTNEWEAALQYLNTKGNTKILSNPKLSVVNNQEAKIHVGKREAYVTTTTTTGQTTSTVSEEVTFIDVGIQLSVTPTINSDGYIRMKVRPEISSVVGSLITPSQNKIPIVDTSLAETTVLVKDGATIVIGGLRKDQKVSENEQVPFFSKIPLIGNLFKKKSTSDEQTELLILLTSHIIDGDRLASPEDFSEEGEGKNKKLKSYRDYNASEEKQNMVNYQDRSKDGIKLYREYDFSKGEKINDD